MQNATHTFKFPESWQDKISQTISTLLPIPINCVLFFKSLGRPPTTQAGGPGDRVHDGIHTKFAVTHCTDCINVKEKLFLCLNKWSLRKTSDDCTKIPLPGERCKYNFLKEPLYWRLHEPLHEPPDSATVEGAFISKVSNLLFTCGLVATSRACGV